MNFCFFFFQKIICLNNADSTDDSNAELTAEELNLLSQDDFYDKLACSLAPEIYGLEDVKKALLLLLVGGTDKKKGDIKIRGINKCKNINNTDELFTSIIYIKLTREIYYLFFMLPKKNGFHLSSRSLCVFISLSYYYEYIYIYEKVISSK